MQADDSVQDTVTIDDLVESFVARLRAGESVTIESYQDQYPQLAEEIGFVFPPLQMLERCRPAEEPPPSEITASDGIPDRLGDYRIIQEIGRGGMGIVYEAEHDSMRRRVALKVLPKNLASRSSNLARFQLEARSAGQMHHTNIVPVFEVGEEHGFHFYAMQFIRGQSLELVIDEMQKLRSGSARSLKGSSADHALAPRAARADHLQSTLVQGPDYGKPHGNGSPSFTAKNRTDNSTDWSEGSKDRSTYIRRVAMIGMQVADALDYAHQNQILHRDIKPANLLLDTDGTVWVTDFGLAKAADDDLTQTGDIVGTLRYMAPERFQGRTDAACDIYGLGLTLYELCTLTTAFRSSTRASLIDQITKHDPPPPRSIDPSIPLDLETIILKAIDRIPERRYPTARHLAEDLQAFLADRPVKARRISVSERLWRVCRRNPITAVLTAASLCLLIAIAAGSSYFSLRLGQQAQALKTENQRAVAAEEDARRVAYEASVGQARSLRQARLPGQHFESLAAVQRAVNYLDMLPVKSEQRRQALFTLRSEAAAALSLTDISYFGDFGQPTNRWWSFSVSNDRQWYAQPMDNGEIVIGRLSDNQEAQRIPALGHQVWVTRFSPEGTHLIAIYRANPSKLVLWRIEDAKPLLEYSHGGFDKFTFPSKDEAIAAIGANLLMFRVGEEKPKKVSMTEFDEGALCQAIVLHPSRRLIAIGLDVYLSEDEETKSDSEVAIPIGRVLIIDLETGDRRFLDMPERVGAIAWVEDHTLAVGYATGLCELWDTETLETLGQFEGHTSRVTTIKSDASGRTLTTRSWDGSFRMWDIMSQRQLTRLNGFEFIATTDTLFDDRLALWTNGQAQVWTSHYGQVRQKEKLNSRVYKGSNHIAITHPNLGHLAFVTTLDGFESWDLATGSQLEVLDRPNPTGMAIINDGRLLMTCGPKGIERWPIHIEPENHAASDGTAHVKIGPPQVVHPEVQGKTTFHDEHTWATMHQPGRARIYTPHSESAHEIEHYALSSLRISPNGKWLATRTWHGMGIKIFDIATGELIIHLLEDTSSPRCAFSPDSQYLVANTRTERFVWRTDGWEPIHQLQRAQPDGWPGRVETASDNRTALLNHSRNRLELFDIVKGESLIVLEPSDVSGRDAGCISQDGRSLLSFHSGGLEIWDLHELRSALNQLQLDWDPPLNAPSPSPIEIEFITE